MFQRLIKNHFLKALRSFPVVILTGPRQSGKSTLCKLLLGSTHGYISLEDPDIRMQALSDPRTFLENYPAPVVFDEIQYAPELPSYIKSMVDNNRHNYGQYVLTGSQNFLMMANVSQSLAGRAALLTLYPCSVEETDNNKPVRSSLNDVADWILRGGYPELRSRPELDRKTWCASYIRLYLERDARQIINIDNLSLFEKFIHLVAIRTGQILNWSDLARDTGVSVPTAMRWLSVLEASYQVFLLPPFHANISKRLIKAPKIYFGDTALASFLMGIHNQEVLLEGPFLGHLFETAVFLEHIKYLGFHSEIPSLSYFRSRDGLEVDLIIEDGLMVHAREIKTTRTIKPNLADNLLKLEKLLKKKLKKVVLAPVEDEAKLTSDVSVRPWQKVGW